MLARRDIRRAVGDKRPAPLGHGNYAGRPEDGLLVPSAGGHGKIED